MSLEDKIQGLTDAVNALTAALKKPEITSPTVDWSSPENGGYGETNPAPAKAEVAPPKPAPTKTSSKTPLSASSTEPSSQESSTSATTQDSGTKDATLTIDYAQVAKAITDTFKVDRAKTIEALAKFGAAKGPQLKPVDYAAFLKELTA